jgi:hypothetical protein
VLEVEDVVHHTRAYATLNEGLGKVLRFGANDDSVMERLRWMARALGPALGRALATSGPIDLKMLTGQALQMGDECHNRNVAATALLARQLAPALVKSTSAEDAVPVLEFQGVLGNVVALEPMRLEPAVPVLDEGFHPLPKLGKRTTDRLVTPGEHPAWEELVPRLFLSARTKGGLNASRCLSSFPKKPLSVRIHLQNDARSMTVIRSASQISALRRPFLTRMLQSRA